MTCKPAREALLRTVATARNGLEPRREAMHRSQGGSSRCLCSSTSAPPARGNEKRGPRSEACHASVWLRFGAATLARRRALRERMP